MDIALIIHELLVEGGGERLCVCLAQALVQHGHKVVLYTSAYDQQNCFPEICKAFTIKEVGRGRFPSLRRPLFVRGYLDMLRLAEAVEERHEIWNPHHWPAQWSAVWLKRKLGGAVVWNCNDVPDFHQKVVHPQSLKGAAFAPLYWLYYRYDRRQNRKVDLTLLLSNWAESEYRAIYSGRTHVVRCGMDPAKFAPGGDRARVRDRFGYSNDDFVLLWLGIFMPHRRLEDGINAIGHLASRGIHVRLLLAGSDRAYPAYVASLKALARNLGVAGQSYLCGQGGGGRNSRLLFRVRRVLVSERPANVGAWPSSKPWRADVQSWFRADLACTKYLADQENALLFSPRNPEELAGKIEVLVSHPDLRYEIARKGMKLARDTYNWDRFTEQIETACRGFVGRKESSAPTAAPTVCDPAG